MQQDDLLVKNLSRGKGGRKKNKIVRNLMRKRRDVKSGKLLVA